MNASMNTPMTTPMNTQDVLAIFEAHGALKRGHFVLSSGLHSDTYLDKSVVSTYPEPTEALCRALAAKVRADIPGVPEFVVSPAMGAIVYGYETARHLGTPFVFAERVDGLFAFRRFPIPEGAKVVVVEDIVSTGLSARECIEAAQNAWHRPWAVGRSGARLIVPPQPGRAGPAAGGTPRRAAPGQSRPRASCAQ